LLSSALASSFFFLPFITFGAVLKPTTAEVPLAAVDFLLLSKPASLSALDYLVSAAGLFSTAFFSSLGFVVAVVGAGLVVAFAPPGAAFFSTTYVTPPAFILSFKLSSMGSAPPSSVAGFLAPAFSKAKGLFYEEPFAGVVAGFLTATEDPPPIFEIAGVLLSFGLSPVEVAVLLSSLVPFYTVAFLSPAGLLLSVAAVAGAVVVVLIPNFLASA
jgi:hypothetical protein